MFLNLRGTPRDIGIDPNHLRMPGYEPAADELTDPREDQIRDITDIDGIERNLAGNGRIDGRQQFFPSQRSDPERHTAGYHGGDYPFPTAKSQPRIEIFPLHTPEGEVEQDDGGQCRDYVFYRILHYSEF